MNRFKTLTRYLPLLERDDLGTWITDQENDGTPEHPRHMPFVNYSVMVHRFIDDVQAFSDDNEDLELYHYYDILEKNGLEWGSQSMSEADVSSLDGQCVMALIMGVIRADRFSEGTLLDFFENGCIQKWLKRLKELDEDTV